MKVQKIENGFIYNKKVKKKLPDDFFNPDNFIQNNSEEITSVSLDLSDFEKDIDEGVVFSDGRITIYKRSAGLISFPHIIRKNKMTENMYKKFGDSDVITIFLPEIYFVYFSDGRLSLVTESSNAPLLFPNVWGASPMLNFPPSEGQSVLEFFEKIGGLRMFNIQNACTGRAFKYLNMKYNNTEWILENISTIVHTFLSSSANTDLSLHRFYSGLTSANDYGFQNIFLAYSIVSREITKENCHEYFESTEWGGYNVKFIERLKEVLR